MNSEKKITGVRKSERGQAIVLMMLLIVGLVGIAGLAVDGGRLYYSQRTAQNAADNAALAAAWAACAGGDVNSVAFASASSNEFDNNGTTNTVTVYRPPSSGPNVGDDEYIEVVIHSVIDAAFSQLVFLGDLESTVRAVSRCNIDASGEIGGGYAIIVLDPNKDRAFHVHGSANVTIDGGGIFVNSNDNDRAFWVHQNAAVVSSGTIDVVGGYQTANTGTASPTPNAGATQISDPLAALPAPSNPGGTCNSYSLGGSSVDTIDPGLYCEIALNGNAILTMNPGIYYIDSGDFTTDSNVTFTANEVLIYLTNGTFDLKGNGDITMTPISSGLYAGMALFLDQSNNSKIKIDGSGTIDVSGTIYAPSSKFEIKGNGSVTEFNTQVLVSEFMVTGSGDIALNYDSENVFQSGAGASLIELAE